MFYNIQTFSFAVIDRFSSSSLMRITTDVMNVQMAYMMLIRTAIRSPLMLVLCLCRRLQHGAAGSPSIFLVVHARCWPWRSDAVVWR